jgi:hypothetical protein
MPPSRAPAVPQASPGQEVSPGVQGSAPAVESSPGQDAEAPPAGPPRPGVDPNAVEGAAPATPPAPGRLTLDVLVYSDVPAERMVFINGKKYIEGQTVDGDAVLEQITPDGAVLSQRGQRVVLRPKLNPYTPRPGSP